MSNQAQKGFWYHPSVRPTSGKYLLCEVAIHPDGTLYHAVWHGSFWTTFSKDAKTALALPSRFDMKMYWRVVQELNVEGWQTSNPVRIGWYKVKVDIPLRKGQRLWARWNGDGWSQFVHDRCVPVKLFYKPDRGYTWSGIYLEE